jgi:hypothetical protein
MGTKGANGSAIDRANRVFRAAFNGAFERTSTRVIDLLTWNFTGGGRENTEHFAVLDGTSVPIHKDRLIYGDYKVYEFDSGTDVYAKGLRLKRDDVENDRFGTLSSLAQQFARHMSVTQRRKVLDFLTLGFGGTLGTAFDGQFFFDTDHPATDGTTWSNSHALDLDLTNFDVLYNALMSTPTPDGDQLYDAYDGEIEVQLLVGPELKAAADDIAKEKLSGGEDNPRSTRITTHVFTDLRAGGAYDAFKDYWWLKAKPVIHPEVQPLTFVGERTPELDMRMERTDPETWETDDYLAKVRGKWGIGYRAPWGIQGSTGA